MQLPEAKSQDLSKTPCSVYLPIEGLQGEEIPSNVTWRDIDVDTIMISFSKPLKIKEVFNATTYEIKDNEILVKDIEVKGYLGLLFETSKVDDIETELPIGYLIITKNGEKFELKKALNCSNRS